MKKHLLSISIIVAILFVSNCNKEKSSQNKTAQTSSVSYFMPFKIGNFWVYKITDEEGDYPNYNIVTTIDTLRIVSDTTINGNHYFEFKSNVIGLFDGLYADSSGVITRLNKGIYPLSTIANDTIALYNIGNYLHVIEHTGTLDTIIQVAAGNFHCLEIVADVYYLQDSPPTPNPNPRETNTCYTKNIGVVKCKTWYSASSGNITFELLSYFIQP